MRVESLLWYLKKGVDFVGDQVYTGVKKALNKGANENIYKNDECYLARRAPRACSFLFIPSNRKEKCTMDYGLIGKIEKAKRYVEERERIKFKQFTVTFEGDNNVHTVKYNDGQWHCTCDFFQTRGRCSHTMALETILEKMVEITRPD